MSSNHLEDTKIRTPNTQHAVVWLTRHAETATPALFHGAESDVELGKNGHQQAAAAAAWFAEQKPTVVVSSAMKRAVQTAAPIAAICGIPHVLEPLLHERQVGSLSLRPREEGDPIWEETLARWEAGDTAYAPLGMESFDAIRERTLPVIHRVVKAHPGGRIVVICHGVVCKVLLLSLLPGYTAADWTKIGRAKNLAVSELVSEASSWAGRELLVVPPPVVAVTATFDDAGVRKTEA